MKAVFKSTAQLKWMRKKTTWNPKRSLRTSWCRSSARITWMFSVSTSFCLVLDKLSNCLALADIQLFYLFPMRGNRPYLFFSVDVVLSRFCVTSFSFLSPLTFLCYITMLRFANLGKETSGPWLSTCNHLRQVQSWLCHLVFLALQLLFSI